KYYFTIIDAPGHRDFVKNMITGTSQAERPCSSVRPPMESRSRPGSTSSSRGRSGSTQLICAINKMDRQEVKYSEEKFKEVVEELTKLLKNVGFKVAEQVVFVPISAFKDDNINKPSPNTPWYKGPTLLQALDNLKVPEKPTTKPLRLPVQDVYTITGIGTVPVGRVETGTMKIGDKIIFLPSGKSGEVKSIEMHHEQVTEAGPGDNVGFNVRGIDKND
ncbi:translation elongation factor EF-1, subunit alpha, partial [mine drainage metagenome]